MDKTKALEALYANRYLCSDKEINLFVEALDVLRGNVLIEDLEMLLPALEDQAGRTELMDELISLIESIDEDVNEYINEFVSNLNLCNIDGRNCCKTIITHMINNTKLFEAICDCVIEEKVDPENLREFAEEMYEETEIYEEHFSIIISLLDGEYVDVQEFLEEQKPKKLSITKQEAIDYLLKNKGNYNQDTLYQYYTALSSDKVVSDITVLLYILEDNNHNYNLRIGYILREYLNNLGPQKYVEGILNGLNDDKIEINKERSDYLLEIIEKQATYNFICSTINSIDKKTKLKNAFEMLKNKMDFTKEKYAEVMECFKDASDSTSNNSVDMPEEFVELLTKLADLQQQMKNIDYMNPQAATSAMKIGLEIGQVNLKMSSIIMHMSMANALDPRINKMNEEMTKVMSS